MASTINTAYTVGSFAKAADGTNALTLQSVNSNALAISTAQNVTLSSTGALTVPSGTTAQRPASPVNGMLRYNTTIPQLELYLNGTWTALP
jgi:hypothetical protein